MLGLSGVRVRGDLLYSTHTNNKGNKLKVYDDDDDDDDDDDHGVILCDILCNFYRLCCMRSDCIWF